MAGLRVLAELKRFMSGGSPSSGLSWLLGSLALALVLLATFAGVSGLGILVESTYGARPALLMSRSVAPSFRIRAPIRNMTNVS